MCRVCQRWGRLTSHGFPIGVMWSLNSGPRNASAKDCVAFGVGEGAGAGLGWL
ncbi:hypothetical protein TR2A62_0004 [Thalassobium sp. R2A62]|nr:hypothetical protein TR2A62_0004 [Thalassobium sp. R2A62]